MALARPNLGPNVRNECNLARERTGRKVTSSRHPRSYRHSWTNVCIRVTAMLPGTTVMGACQTALPVSTSPNSSQVLPDQRMS